MELGSIKQKKYKTSSVATEATLFQIIVFAKWEAFEAVFLWVHSIDWVRDNAPRVCGFRGHWECEKNFWLKLFE